MHAGGVLWHSSQKSAQLLTSLRVVVAVQAATGWPVCVVASLLPHMRASFLSAHAVEIGATIVIPVKWWSLVQLG